MPRTYYRDFRDGEQHRYTSDLVHNQVPEFMTVEGPVLVKMLEEYYNFLHTGGNVESAAKNVIKLNDVDEVGEYYEQYKRDTGGQYTSANTVWLDSGQTFLNSIFDLWRDQYLLNFPSNTSSFVLFVKKVLDVYRAKGSNQGFEALLRGIYGLDAEVRNPYEYTFKPSEGVWRYDEYLQAIYNPELEKWAGLRIYGISSEASAIVQRINKKLVNGKLIAQIVLTDISEKQFEHNEPIYTEEYPDVSIRIITGIQKITLTANGSEFTPGDIIDIENNGIEGRAVIVSSETFNGRLSFTLSNPSEGYRANSIVTVSGGVGGSGGAFRIGGIKAPFRVIEYSQDQIGSLAANSQIQINEGPNFIVVANSQLTSTQVYTNQPIAGPNVANGLNISWSNGSNTAALDADVANNTFTNGSIWYIGNTTPGPSGDHTGGAGMVVHDYDPGTQTITFTSQTMAAASTNTAVIRAYAANTVYTLNSNLVSANVSSTLASAFNYDTDTFGAIDFIVTTETGRDYVVAPTATIVEPAVYSLRIPNGAGGYLGSGAVVDVGLLANNVITGIKVLDHGFGYTNAASVTLRSLVAKGTDATGLITLGGVARTEGGWVETQSFPSSNQRIHDSKRYQAFSYEIVTEEALSTYKKTLTSITHPAGTRMFGIYQTQQTSSQGVGDTTLDVSSYLDVTVGSGGIEIANNTSTVIGSSTAFTSDIQSGDELTTNGLTFVANVIGSNTSVTANGFIAASVSNSSVFTVDALTVLTGDVSISNGSHVITGTGTIFTNELKLNDVIVTSSNVRIGTVNAVTSNTQIRLANTYTGDSLIDATNIRLFKLRTLQPYELSGELSVNDGNFNLSGQFTRFENELQTGDQLFLGSNNIFVGMINKVSSNTSANLVQTFTSPNGTNLTDSVMLRRDKVSKIIIQS